MDLRGIWRFRLDKEDEGIKKSWYQEMLENAIQISGTLQEQGYGDRIGEDTPFVDGLHDRLWFLREEMQDFRENGEVCVPFLAQPCRHYLGAAWYQRDLEISPEWENKSIELFMELVRWKTTVWIDDVCFGDFTSLCVPHRYHLGVLKPGRHVLTVRVDNRMILPYRPDAHGVSDSVGHTWNGIAGRVELAARDEVFIENIAAYPDCSLKTIRLKLQTGNDGEERGCWAVISGEALLCEKGEQFVFFLKKGQTSQEFEMRLREDALPWDEFSPVLHELAVSLYGEDGSLLTREKVSFGLRDITTEGRRFLLNGRVISFRGTHDGGCFPLTGYPAYELKEWRRICGICREWGLNHIRFHSWCPPEAAFLAADEAGIYLQIETGMWNYFIQGGEIEQELYRETDRILEAFGNHPSFLLLSSGNEPHGEYKPVVKKWVEYCRRVDNRHLYCAQSGWLWPIPPEKLEVTDYFYTCSRYNTSKMRGREGWFGADYQRYLEDMEAPFICHELGQYCSYPDFSQIEKFRGYLRPGNFVGFRNLARRHGLLGRNKDFVMASGHLQLLAYKEEIEANLRTPGFSGFSLLDLHDYPGQGGALVGLLDVFWDPKPYAEPGHFRRFCGATVPLARLERVNYRIGEKLCAEVEIACYEQQDYRGSRVYWRLLDESGEIHGQGCFAGQDIPTGGNTHVGRIEQPLETFPAPGRGLLEIGIEGTGVQNSWEIYVYPQKTDCRVPEGVLVAVTLADAMKGLAEGKKVLFLPRREMLHYNSPQLSPLPTFWNGRMGPKWSRGLGMWCNTEHGALASFPTESAAGWQWMEILENARGMNVEGLPEELAPFLCPIDDWNRSYRLALAFEARLNGGKLLVCSADLPGLAKENLAAAQLLQSFLTYMDSERFAPEVEVTEEQLGTFLLDTAIMIKKRVGIQLVEGFAPGEAEPETNPVKNLLDGDPNTYWLAGGNYGGSYPFTLELTVPEPVKLRGLRLLPRQNHRDWEGQVKACEVYAEQEDGWGKVYEGELSASAGTKEIFFSKAIVVSRLRLRLLEGFGADNLFFWDRREKVGFFSRRESYRDECASMAEVDFICVDAEETEAPCITYQDAATASEEIY